MTGINENQIIKAIAESIDIPDSAYEQAKKRYQDIGEWFNRSGSICAPYNPHIIPQGSFRLGTVTKPPGDKDEYDLDLTCKLRDNISKTIHSQYRLKEIVGKDVKAYREYRGIENKEEEKHRCWRLVYKDQLQFHMDIVPCIPEDEKKYQGILEAMIKQGVDESLSADTSRLTVSITDNRHEEYYLVSDDWNISNPEGYALWFESRMKLSVSHLQELMSRSKVATVEELPVYKWKTTLQRCVQLLKRHRDVMFADLPDAKPISIIITTLAGRAYNGESRIDKALNNILTTMGDFISPQTPRVPNPVDPSEDFADKWPTEKGKQLKLEEHFRTWLRAAQRDFQIIIRSNDIDFINEQIKEKMEISLNLEIISKVAPAAIAPTIIFKPKEHIITEKNKPWLKMS